MNAWVLPFRVDAFETDRAEASRVMGVPYDDFPLSEPLIGVRVSDGDGDAMCDLAVETSCECAECSEGFLCPRAMITVLLAVQDDLERMGARPVVPVGWNLDCAPALAELRSPDPGLN